MRKVAAGLALLTGLTLARASAAFCGFYVSGADTKLVNRATQVVLMRAGTRTVLSMQNAYEGPPQDFAMVVPVPVVLQKEQVKTLPRDVLDRVDRLGSPRLVEYWEQDPCATPPPRAGTGTGQGFGSGHGRLGGSHRTKEPEVKIEAQFDVGEYEVVILSATDATALDTWLRDNHYKIPDGAEPYLRPYVQSGMKFFVAKVDIEKVTMKDGRAILSPLRFHYDSDTFNLPIRLGLINSGDAQDLIVSILAQSQRYEVANYPNVVIPTNLDVADSTRQSFSTFYAALLDETLRQKPGAVVTEYAWDAGTCDPCPGPTLNGQDVATLGADVLAAGDRENATGGGQMRGATVKMMQTAVSGKLPAEVIQRIIRQSFGRYRLCYENGLRNNPNLGGGVKVKFVITRDGSVQGIDTAGSDLPDKPVVDCVGRSFLGLSFPQPDGGIVTATQGFTFSPYAASTPRNMVLTRLHMRYTKDALGEDLVFKAAQPIEGGRETRGGRTGLELEQGAEYSHFNNFQARYAIRHPWTGPVACANPIRNIWGGPVEGGTPPTTAARDLAFVKRGADLSTFLTAALPPVSGPGDAPSETPPASSAPATASSSAPSTVLFNEPDPSRRKGCGCNTASQTSDLGWAVGAALSGAVSFARRRRRSQQRR